MGLMRRLLGAPRDGGAGGLAVAEPAHRSPLADLLRPGDGLGVPLYLAGPDVVAATLIPYADTDNIEQARPVLWIDVTLDRFEALATHAERNTTPVWPFARLVGAIATWDGVESAASPAAQAAMPIPGVTVTWQPRPGGGRIAISVPQTGVDPIVLVQAALDLGITTGILDGPAQEERFLRAVSAATIVEDFDPHGDIPAMRAGLARRLGYPSPDAMTATAGYHPHPDPRARGWEVWLRVPPADANPVALLDSYVIVHRVTGSNRGGSLVELFAHCGAVLSQDRRIWAGASVAVGASENADAATGASEYVFAEITDYWPNDLAPALVWDQPSAVIERADWLGVPLDPVSVRPGRWLPVYDWRKAAITTVEGLAALGPGTQVAFHGGLDLFGRDAPSRVICRDNEEREDLLSMLRALGVEYLGDQPAAKVIIARPPIAERR